MILGFSTGSLAKGDFKEALRIMGTFPDSVQAIELSALRESELPLLIHELPYLDLHAYKYISVHAPSKLVNYSEGQVVTFLLEVASSGYPVIVHPDIITDFSKWRKLGKFLCIENMDKRKPVGGTVRDLERIFNLLPDASFCLDLAHAKQVDPTMVECAMMLRKFSNRLIQFHISDVTSDSNHVPINLLAIESYRKVAPLISFNVPFIIESPVSGSYVQKEIQYMSSVFHINDHYFKTHHPFVSNKFQK